MYVWADGAHEFSRKSKNAHPITALGECFLAMAAGTGPDTPPEQWLGVAHEDGRYTVVDAENFLPDADVDQGNNYIFRDGTVRDGVQQYGASLFSRAERRVGVELGTFIADEDAPAACNGPPSLVGEYRSPAAPGSAVLSTIGADGAFNTVEAALAGGARLDITAQEGCLLVGALDLGHGGRKHVAMGIELDGTTLRVAMVDEQETEAPVVYSAGGGYVEGSTIHFHVATLHGVAPTDGATLIDADFVRVGAPSPPPRACPPLVGTVWTSAPGKFAVATQPLVGGEVGEISVSDQSFGATLRVDSQRGCALGGTIEIRGPLGGDPNKVTLTTTAATREVTVGAYIHRDGRMTLVEVGNAIGGTAEVEAIVDGTDPSLLHLHYVGHAPTGASKFVFDADLACTCPETQARRLLFASLPHPEPCKCPEAPW